jgi:hypothetical protein
MQCLFAQQHHCKKNADGSITVQFDGCDGKVANRLLIRLGWNYTVRLYQPRAEILSGRFGRSLEAMGACTSGRTGMPNASDTHSSSERRMGCSVFVDEHFGSVRIEPARSLSWNVFNVWALNNSIQMNSTVEHGRRVRGYKP